MVEASLGTDVILAKIRKSSCSFDTSTDALKKLKGKKIPESIIVEMVKAPVARKVLSSDVVSLKDLPTPRFPTDQEVEARSSPTAQSMTPDDPIRIRAMDRVRAEMLRQRIDTAANTYMDRITALLSQFSLVAQEARREGYSYNEAVLRFPELVEIVDELTYASIIAKSYQAFAVKVVTHDVEGLKKLYFRKSNHSDNKP